MTDRQTRDYLAVDEPPRTAWGHMKSFDSLDSALVKARELKARKTLNGWWPDGFGKIIRGALNARDSSLQLIPSYSRFLARIWAFGFEVTNG